MGAIDSFEPFVVGARMARKHELLVAALIARQFRLPTGLYHKFLMSLPGRERRQLQSCWLHHDGNFLIY